MQQQQPIETFSSPAFPSIIMKANKGISTMEPKEAWMQAPKSRKVCEEIDATAIPKKYQSGIVDARPIRKTAKGEVMNAFGR